MKVALIASTGRTGTGFLGRMLSSVVPGACSEHEPDVLMGLSRKDLKKIAQYGLWHTVFGRLAGRTGLRNHAYNYATGRISAEETIRRVRRERERIYRRCEREMYIDSYYQWTLLLPLVPDLFDNYLIVGITRHPLAYIGSMSDYVDVKDRGWHGLDRVPLLRQAVHRKITPADVGDKLPSDIADAGKVHLAWEWAYWNRRLVDACEGSDNARLFQFEEIFNSTNNEKRKELLEFIGGPQASIPDEDIDKAFSTALNTAPQTAIRNWKEWHPRDLAAVRELCGDLMDRIGYSFDQEDPA